MKQTITVNILNKQYTMQLNQMESFESLTKILFNYLKSNWNTDLNTHLQFNDAQEDLQNSLQFDHQQQAVTLSKNHLIKYKHPCFDEFKFMTNYYGTIEPFLQYVNKEINKYSVPLEATLLVEDKPIDKGTFWCSMNSQFTLLIECNIKINEYSLKANLLWKVKKLLAQLKKLKVKEIVLLKVNEKEVHPNQTMFSLLQEKNPVFTFTIPTILKYYIKNLKKELLPISIPIDKPVLDLYIGETSKLPITQTIQLCYDGVILEEQKPVNEYKIPYNSILDCQIVKKHKVNIQLRNLDTLRSLNLIINANTLLKNIDAIIFQENKKDVQYYVNGEQLIDKSLTIDQLDLQQNSVFGYKVISQIQEESNQLYFPSNEIISQLIKIRIIIGSQALTFEIDSKTTVQKITDQVTQLYPHKNLSQCKYNNQILQPDTVIGNLDCSTIELSYN